MVTKKHYKSHSTSDSDSSGDYFFVLGKTHNGPFLGIFKEALTFLIPKLPIAALMTINRSKKSWPHWKKPLKWPIMCVARKKNNITHFQNQQYINS